LELLDSPPYLKSGKRQIKESLGKIDLHEQKQNYELVSTGKKKKKQSLRPDRQCNQRNRNIMKK
jgi:hypothetical protein